MTNHGMHRSHLAVLGALVALGVTCWFASGESEGEGRVGRWVPKQAPSREVAEFPASPVIRTEPFVAQTAGAAADQVLVHVVDEETRSSVPGACVYRLDRRGDAGSGRSLRERMLEFGERVTADARGEVTMAGGDGSVALMGTASGRIGYGRLVAGASRVTLVLQRDVSIPVQVVDGAGKPVAGVPVALRRRDRYDHRVSQPVLTRGPDGLAVVPVAPQFLGRDQPDTGFVVAIETGVVPRIAHPVSLRQPPTAPVRLSLPVTGAIDVRIRRLDGTPMPVQGGRIDLHVASEDDAARRVPFDLGARLDWSPLSSDRHRFAHVGLGKFVAVVVEIPTESEPWVAWGRGPQRAGETVFLTAQPTHGAPRVRFRAVSEEEVPVANALLEIEVFQGAHGRLRRTVQSDERGHFEVVIEEPYDPRTRRFLRVRQLVDRWSAKRRSEALAEISRDLPPGTSDLGDLALGPPPVILRGIVVTGTGEAVAGAAVSVCLRRPGREEPWWQTLEGRFRTDDSGRFEVRAWLRAHSGVLRLEARRRGHTASVPSVHRAGASGVRLVLDATASILGSVEQALLPLIQDGLSLELRPAGAPGSEPLPAPQWLGRRFRWVGVPAGTYHVELRYGSSAPIVAIGGVVAGPGDVVRDPRLRDVCAKGPRAIVLAVQDRAGRPISGASVQSANGFTKSTADDGKLTFITGVGNDSFAISHPRFGSAIVSDVRSDVVVVLREPPVVEFAIVGTPWVPRDGQRLCVELEPVESWASLSRPVLDVTRGRARARLSWRGKYLVFWFIQETVGGVQRVRRPVPGPAIVVPDAADPRVDLPLTPQLAEKITRAELLPH